MPDGIVEKGLLISGARWADDVDAFPTNAAELFALDGLSAAAPRQGAAGLALTNNQKIA